MRGLCFEKSVATGFYKLSTDSESIVRVRLFAAARDAVGSSEIISNSASAESILAAIAENNLQASIVFARCSILIDGELLHDRSTFISDGSEMEVLPPFAGGST